MPLPVNRALRKLGRDLRDARLRRRMPVALVAERASMSRVTLGKIERGDPGVALGNYAKVLFSLGLLERLAAIAEPAQDKVGLQLEEGRLPKRIHLPREPWKPDDRMASAFEHRDLDAALKNRGYASRRTKD
ncbi:MAG: helix-turn-helix domain-containing protein [Bryobacteraceae bacterium]|nr:helix-turn-helix domain-containing protein [Bryobacteraceae bacterium]